MATRKKRVAEPVKKKRRQRASIEVLIKREEKRLEQLKRKQKLKDLRDKVKQLTEEVK